MRPSLLEIEGLQSFIKNQVIDFSKVNQNGLFGIFGNTGSGKSTILDAITLALYGRVKRVGNTKQGIININCQVARVKFTFKIANDTYRVEREYKRKKGSDSTVESKVVRLIMIHESGDLLICDKEEAVNKKVEEIIGLTHKDFTKAVVLPQNNFQEFLLLGNSERRKMLERVFYLEEYGEELSKKISNKIGLLKNKTDEFSGELKRYEDSSDEAIALYKKELEEAKNKKEQSDAKLKEIQKEHEDKKEIFDLSKELQDTLLKFEDVSKRDHFIESQKEKLELANKASLLEERLKNTQELYTDVKNKQKEINAYQKELPDLENKVLELSKKCDELKNDLRHRDVLQENMKLELDIVALKKDILDFSKKEQKLQDEINKGKQEVVVFSDKALKLEREYNSLKKSEMDSMCSFIAKNLKNGDVCPVCGNTYNKTCDNNLEDVTIDVNKLDEIEKKISDVNIKKEGILAKIETNQNFLKDYRKEIEEKNNILEESLERYDMLLKEYGISNIKEELDNMNKKEKEIVKIDKNLKEYDIKLRDMVNKKTSAQAKYETYFVQYEKESKLLKKEMEEKGFLETGEIIKNILSKEARESIEQEVENHKLKKVEILGQKKSILKKLDGRTITNEEWEIIHNKYNEILDKNKDYTTKYDIAKDVYNKSKEKNKEWKKFKNMYEEVSLKYDKLNKLRDLLNGDRGKDNSFIDYIAEERLRYVAKRASELLGIMTQYKFALTLDAESGFRIIDNRNGGVSRSVNTLSGGETFLTSLALALALSEQIQLKGKSPLEFFFLDEGFGSLDNELLDLVIDALERISKKERVIGVISHILELRQRIPGRIIVTAPTDNGVGSIVSIEKA